MVLKFLRMGMVTFFLYSIVAVPILFPIITINQGNLSGLNYLTMGNVIDDNRLWAHCILAVLLAILVWYYTFRETKIYINLRRKYLLSSAYADTVAARTLFVPSIPKDINTADELEKIFNKFPGGVRRIWLNRKLGDLPKLVQKRQKAAITLEHKLTKAILATYNHRMKNNGNRIMEEEEGVSDVGIPQKFRPTQRDNAFCIPLPCFGEKVDTIRYYHNQIKKLNDKITTKQEDAHNLKQVNSAFIEFNQQIAAHMAAQSLMHKRAMEMAPRYNGIAPSDVIWENMNIHSFERMLRRIASMSVTAVIIAFWAVPVIFIQAVANIDTLSKALPFLAGIKTWPDQVVGIIQGILPSVALAILIALVPIIFKILSTLEGIPQKSFVELSVLHKFFFFQLVDVVLISTLSGGFLQITDQFAHFAQEPFQIINVLSENLPKASTFFITFVMLQSTNQSGQTMVQLVPFLLSYLTPFLNGTPRDICNSKKTCPTISLGTLIPAQTVIFILGLEYGVISPLILPFVLLFFMLQYFVYLYQFLYVYELPYETAGRHFPRAIRHIYIGQIISQLTLIGLFAIRPGTHGQMGVMIATLVFTCFALYYYNHAFRPLFKYLPVSSFKDVDMSAKYDSVLDEDEKYFTAHTHDEKMQLMKSAEPLTSQQDSDNSNSSDENVYHKVDFTKLATHSSLKSRTFPEAYCARRQLLQRLESEQKKDIEEIKKDNDRIIRTAKSLYDTESYMHPSTYSPAPTIWLPEDELGIAQNEVKELKANNIEATTRGAAIEPNKKGKGRVTIDEDRFVYADEGAPGANSSPGEEAKLHDYVRVLVDSYNFTEAITMY
ncbi:hypothetical protein BDF20DRAFT_907786 [Mycotypha africana]|uniref:uncharacterized protein n=1 Tax=Mycotypha africana TaxID=64632 RepID=UPI0023007E7D|nr:uncharacterized protein BDF20DRAFT_907786 [Mycotypha africana]KAI8968906.1 hypothetical protein BDF20DRAFT_907786 [Mycotypha africana]